jgi:uncharacterized protein YkwD
LLLIIAGSMHSSFRLLAAAGQANPSQQPATGTMLQPAAATSADLPFTDDSQAEQMLLQFANQARAKVGVPALQLDPGLCRAAQAHALTMLSAHELSHQFEGEPSLPQRLAAATHIQLDQEAENVALDYNPEDGHKHLMLSAPHRANLLNPAYNVIGVGVVHAGDRLYIVQDFAHALPIYSPAEFKNHIAAAVTQARRQANQPGLTRLDSLSKDLPGVDAAACSMAQAEQLITPSIHQLAQRYTVLAYTGLNPDTLPSTARPSLSAHNLRSFSIGTCYARTPSYPTGAYWILLALQ